MLATIEISREFDSTDHQGKVLSKRFFFEAKLGSKPSFAWTIIQGARDLLEVGYFGELATGKMCAYGEIIGYPNI